MPVPPAHPRQVSAPVVLRRQVEHEFIRRGFNSCPGNTTGDFLQPPNNFDYSSPDQISPKKKQMPQRIEPLMKGD